MRSDFSIQPKRAQVSCKASLLVVFSPRKCTDKLLLCNVFYAVALFFCLYEEYVVRYFLPSRWRFFRLVLGRGWIFLHQLNLELSQFNQSNNTVSRPTKNCLLPYGLLGRDCFQIVEGTSRSAQKQRFSIGVTS